MAFLLDPDELYAIRRETFWRAGLMNLGQLASEETAATTARIVRAESTVGSGLLADWQRLMAAEWLLATASGSNPMGTALDRFADVRVFGPKGPTAREAAKDGAAAVLVPLAAQIPTQEPGLAALFLVRAGKRQKADHRAHWEGADGFLKGKHLRLYTLRWPEIPAKVDGPSWRLGAELAAKCLGEGVLPSVALSLTRNWLPTGDVNSEGKIGAVDIGNKAELHVLKRQWLVASCQTMPPESNQRHARAATLDVAWNHIMQKGTVEEVEHHPWPAGVAELHSFVSGAREPVIAAALLAKPKRLFLWRTKDELVSRRRANDIRRILKVLRPGLRVHLRNIPSDSMHLVELGLEKHLKTRPGKGDLLLFNVTQGNRLMGFAVHTLARRYAWLWMLYRDLNNKGLDFTAIRYDDGRDYPVTSILRPPGNGPAGIAWDELLKQPGPREPEPWADLLRRIRKKESNAASS